MYFCGFRCMFWGVNCDFELLCVPWCFLSSQRGFAFFWPAVGRGESGPEDVLHGPVMELGLIGFFWMMVKLFVGPELTSFKVH
jgi:hypothetical protein